MGSRLPFLTDIVQVISLLWASFFPCETMFLDQGTLKVKDSSSPNKQTTIQNKNSWELISGSVVIAKKQQHPLAHYCGIIIKFNIGCA